MPLLSFGGSGCPCSAQATPHCIGNFPPSRVEQLEETAPWQLHRTHPGVATFWCMGWSDRQRQSFLLQLFLLSCLGQAGIEPSFLQAVVQRAAWNLASCKTSASWPGGPAGAPTSPSEHLSPGSLFPFTPLPRNTGNCCSGHNFVPMSAVSKAERTSEKPMQLGL